MEKTIELDDGSTKTVSGDIITEHDGAVYVFPEEATAVGVLTGDTDFDKYDNASIL